MKRNYWNHQLAGGLLALLLLCFLLTACNNENASNSKEEGTESEVFEFSMMANLHTPEVPDEKILKLIEENTSTKTDIQWVPDNNYEDRLSTAFATNTLPDAIFLKNQNTFSQYKEAIRDGQFWEIGQYLDEFENLQKLKVPILDNTRINGELYSLYQGRPLSRQGLIYRKDWADNLSLAAPATTEEFMEMARAFTEDDPDGNGKDDTFGVTDRGDLVYGAFKTVSSWFGTPNNWGEKDGQLLPEFMFDEYKETMNFFKELHENGYINQDFPVASSNDQIEFMKNGSAGLFVGNMEYVGTLHQDAVAINPETEYGVINNIKGPDGEFGVWAIPGYGNLVLFPKSSVQSEEELKKILAFFDKMMTPENANLISWGIEGEHYEVVDGKALPVDNQSLTEREVKPYSSIEIGEPDTNGRYEALIEYETKAEAVELVKENENHLIVDPTITLDSETATMEGNRLQSIITDATYQYILGQIDEAGFDAAIEKWKSEGGNDIIEEYNASYKSHSK
ncbi:carbohydrate ABC transporter substrate-binding protein, CUT1 family (TC 3.A.1.1.-) [Gracilibacillus ureilyticus]|uniref:Carbohydrate ABC transporter substrate-binding protein, CUT1 family (TC 3.A.1.1.-) n=1 Tax=Gracilibacillus ureilyticus TaxID=531814 RepID=A0A1H9U885_9BACI|nr:extracellular solute-binding protein [Gracilibacillus ureilyticus]SES05364.1 carbohydrate ABC transporter substrate-binding protein, CUT1 family (TC 3.A.1.1.-) [Gracilibacillus ureilyticus]